jgi:hypothetical protein
VEEREKYTSRGPESEAEKSDDEDVEAHRQKVRATEEGSEEGSSDDDVELHRQRTR